ncbi:MAG: hypothetical protein PHG66_06860 [Candidatus Colwellbacteria bacterium]|nr:hypothetical protein [Candidatus Colwellbacteria bacterium]
MSIIAQMVYYERSLNQVTVARPVYYTKEAEEEGEERKIKYVYILGFKRRLNEREMITLRNTESVSDVEYEFEGLL